MKIYYPFIPIFLFCAACAANKSFTYKDIISKLYDLPTLAELPEKGEKGALFSSYDRRSKYDEKTDTYINWFANDDWAGVIRQESENVVLAEIDGPGVIWRMWSATVADGNVKIYLDGKLTVDLPWKDYFNRKVAPFNREGLVYTTKAGGANNYTPIPFQKSCKIVSKATIEQSKKFDIDPGVWGKFFHFNYTIFPKGTKVKTFQMKLSRSEDKALDKANEILTTKLGENPVAHKNSNEEIVKWIIPPGESRFLNITGRRAITALKVQIPENKNYKDLLRQLTLSINWDNEPSPSVWSPIGDYFGTAPGINEYKSLVMGMVSKIKGQRLEVRDKEKPLEKGKSNSSLQYSNTPCFFDFYSYWYMPFDKNAKISIKNESSEDQQISLIVEHVPLKATWEKLGYFHAKWHRDLEPETKKNFDWKILETSGRGRFVGTMLHVWNPRGGWWGEGDEKFYVDGEKFPSTFGTGSEDYFGYAWCLPDIFSQAFHCQTTNFHNRGHVSNNRWHIGDNIPFQKSFAAYIEKYHKNTRPTFYTCVAYWYLSKSGADNIKETPAKDRTGYYAKLIIFKEKDALEAEKLPIIRISKGKTNPQFMLDYGKTWSDDNQLFWTGGKPGDFMELEIDSKENAEKNLIVQFTKADDYAKIQLYFNGEKVGKEIDCYSPNVIVSGKINFGKVKIKKGKNILKVKITGSNSKAKKFYAVGLDYIKFDK